jgi:uncharacterized repeat protein (TIGR03833 family)
LCSERGARINAVMGKHNRPAAEELTRPTSTSAPFNNPFAALSALRNELRSQPPPEALAAAAPASPLEACVKLVVQRERKGRAGKTVTRVSGLAAELARDLAPRLKSALGCGATVEGEDLVLLGDLVERAADWFRAEGARQVVVSGNQSAPAPSRPSGGQTWREGTRRDDLEPGLTVEIVLKRDQPTGALTRGVIQEILTPGATHPRGIKVRLTDGSVGRVKRVLDG